MVCANCQSEIDPDAAVCPVCHVYQNSLKIEDETAELSDRVAILSLENGVKYDLLSHGLQTITVGRKDLISNPVIDLGPYDDGPYISRTQGLFYLENDGIYFQNKGKNSTRINAKPLLVDEKILLKDHDKIQFGQIRAEILLN